MNYRCISKEQCLGDPSKQIQSRASEQSSTSDSPETDASSSAAPLASSKSGNKVFGERCVALCPAGYQEDASGTTCVLCEGSCPVVCLVNYVISSLIIAEKLEACTKINGSLIISLRGVGGSSMLPCILTLYSFYCHFFQFSDNFILLAS